MHSDWLSFGMLVSFGLSFSGHYASAQTIRPGGPPSDIASLKLTIHDVLVVSCDVVNLVRRIGKLKDSAIGMRELDASVPACVKARKSPDFVAFVFSFKGQLVFPGHGVSLPQPLGFARDFQLPGSRRPVSATYP